MQSQSYTPESYHKETLYADRARRNDLHRPNSEHLLRRLGKSGLATALYCAQLLAADVVEGISEGKERVRNDHAQVHSISTADELPPGMQDHATFVLTGLGTKNPSETAHSLESHQKFGNVYAIEYSNNDLNPVDMAERIIERAAQDDVQTLSFDGYSAGGPIALAIAAHIHENEPDLRVMSVTLNSSPIGQGSLTERSEKSLSVMNRLLSVYDDLVYYEKGRIGIEVLARSNRYIQKTASVPSSGVALRGVDRFSVGTSLYTIDYEQLREQIHSVREKMSNPDAAAASLVKRQADFITSTDYDNNLRRLAEAHDDTFFAPLITYTRSKLPEDDAVVDVIKSEQNLLRSVEQHGNRHFSLQAEVGHANPRERPKAYAEIIQEKIQPKIAQSLGIYAARETIAQYPSHYEYYSALDGDPNNQPPPN